jgi:tripartite-type tricarboxylate transporter receptor subunit TctC
MRKISRLWIATLFLVTASAWAQFPTKPVTIVVPFPPGGSNDVFARSLAKKLSDSWKQPVVVDNKAGAGGMIGAAQVSKAPADGYTLLFVSSSYTTGAAIQQLPFDPITGLTPIASVAKGPMVLTVKNGVAVKNAAELAALARSQPGKLNFGSAGPGSINHFAAELFAQNAGVKMTHVPYKGMGPATADLIGGHIDVLIASSPSVMQHVKTEKVKGLGVTSAKASPLVPGLEPVANGVKGYEVELWWGVLGPPGLPPAVLAAINTEINKALVSAEMTETFAKEGAEPWAQSSAQFSDVVKGDIERWKKVARDANIKVE